MDPTFFPTPRDFRSWLAKHHASEGELWVGFYKKATGRASITWPESVDEALCFGWIDGVRRGGEATWTIRFTPRRPKSIWSAINIKRIEELKADGRLHPAGLAAYETRDPERQKRYSHENRTSAVLAPAEERAFRANKKAWEYFSAMPPSYRRPAIWWVVSAKREETRTRRLQTLIADSAAGRKIKPLTLPSRKT
jgi:uncharacterized protein YdeI (YjbR/CyaY-like superfamily)